MDNVRGRGRHRHWMRTCQERWPSARGTGEELRIFFRRPRQIGNRRELRLGGETQRQNVDLAHVRGSAADFNFGHAWYNSGGRMVTSSL